MALQYGAKEVCDVTFIDLTTNKPVLYIDTLKVSSLENKADQAVARGGKGNPKRLIWDFNREATVKISNALMSLKSLSLSAGTSITTGAQNVFKRELLTVATNKVNTTDTPVAGSVTVLNSTDGSELTGVTVSGNQVTLTGQTDGTLVEVFYTTNKATTSTFSIKSNAFPSYYKIIGDTVIRNANTGVDEAFQMVIYKAKVSPNFTMDFKADGDPSQFDMDLDVFPNASNVMVDFIKY
jgi:hypothetical protein